MIPQFAHTITERKSAAGQPNLLKLGLAVTAIHALLLLILLGKGLW